MLRSFFLSLLLTLIPLATLGQSTDLQYTNPAGQDGINTFETPTEPGVEYDGFVLDWGGAFTQQFQRLSQSNEAGTFPELGGGFNLATANLDLGAQLAPGIQVNVRTYLSSRHHPEAWVKGGYLQVNELPMFNSAAVDRLMENVTVRAGHFEINYGDGHFRRTDNANAIHNPFVGNYLLDAFTTEIGGEVYIQSNGLIAMGGITGGEINGGITNPDQRAPSFYGKLGVDRQVNETLRFRLTGSAYYTRKSINNTLHSGDRSGSRYYSVMNEGDWSGRIRSSFGNQVTALMLNPFVKVGGLELFGLVESVSGSRAGLDDGSLNQYAGEVIYRFADDDLYVGTRYNTVNGDHNLGDPIGWESDLTVNRWQIGAGWFMTPNVLVKGEYVTQSYDGYPQADARHGGEFNGIMIEGVVAF